MKWLIGTISVVLSLGDDAATRKLVRLLLADPLGPKEEWEDYLDSYDMSSSQGLLIRYGTLVYFFIIFFSAWII